MVTDSYIQKYGHSRVRSREEIQKPMAENTNKTKTPAELIEKPKHPDIIKINPILRDPELLDFRSKRVWKFIREGR